MSRISYERQKPNRGTVANPRETTQPTPNERARRFVRATGAPETWIRLLAREFRDCEIVGGDRTIQTVARGLAAMMGRIRK